MILKRVLSCAVMWGKPLWYLHIQHWLQAWNRRHSLTAVSFWLSSLYAGRMFFPALGYSKQGHVAYLLCHVDWSYTAHRGNKLGFTGRSVAAMETICWHHSQDQPPVTSRTVVGSHVGTPTQESGRSSPENKGHPWTRAGRQGRH